jgi:hypothetical protein
MRFLSIYKTVEKNAPPSLEQVAKMEKLIEESMKAGVLLATEGCLPSALGARVRLSDGKLTVTDGPFTESKDHLGGFYVIEANDLDAALAWAGKLARALTLDQRAGLPVEVRPFQGQAEAAGESRR